MNVDDAIPASYQQWRHCIEVRGGIELTRSFIDQRLLELQDNQHEKTKEFEEFYGATHLQRTIDWFHLAAAELRNTPRESRHV